MQAVRSYYAVVFEVQFLIGESVIRKMTAVKFWHEFSLKVAIHL